MNKQSIGSSGLVIGMKVDPASLPEAVGKVIGWAEHGESRYVCAANVHMTMEAFDDHAFQSVVNRADLVVSDGRPLVWAIKMSGATEQRQVRGEDLTVSVCAAAAANNIPVGLYGSSPQNTQKLAETLRQRNPGLQIVFLHSPVFRDLTPLEDEKIIRQINEASVRILFVALGCPKQEKWMAHHRGKIRAVMIGVGAAFDFLSGAKAGAPKWLQIVGLEWLFRLGNEPKRLWRRYLYNNPRFVYHVGRQLICGRAPNMQSRRKP